MLEIEDKFPDRDFESVSNEFAKISSFTKILPTPDLIRKNADLAESCAYKMAEQSDQMRMAADETEKLWLKWFNDGGWRFK